MLTCHHGDVSIVDVSTTATKRSTAKRREQLRIAKREQRRRERTAGLASCQIVIPQAVAELLREAARHPDVMLRLASWLELEIVDARDWPQLDLLCWNRRERRITGAEALALYERNWRFIAPSELSEDEARFIARLAGRHGHGVLHV